MKPRLSQKRNAAMTLFEVGIVIAVVMILAVLLLPMLGKAQRRSSRIGCVNNLKQIGLSDRIWAGDNGDFYPMSVSVTNGGSMEMVATGNVLQTFLVMSNELSTPKILHCPEDAAHIGTNLFSGLSNSNISFFVALDVTNEANPQMFLSGDANFEIGGIPAKSGLLVISSNAPIGWSAARHKFSGNIALADGSVQSGNNSALTNWLHQTGLATNRLALP